MSTMNQIIRANPNYTGTSEESGLIGENLQIHTLSTSITIRKQIVSMIEHIEGHEFSLPNCDKDSACILRAEEDFYYNDCYNFWYAVNDNGLVIGSIGMEKIDEHNAEVRKFFVDQGYRGKGVALKLMHMLIKAASRHRIDCLYLKTLAIFQAAQSFYKKHGFYKISEQQLPLGFKPCSSMTCEFFKAKVCELQPKFHGF